ncbi:MAG TPA: terminase [Candidatus Aminicenantes bacterium]|nr:terminase [Candidatus Aminicenantes bacterium]
MDSSNKETITEIDQWLETVRWEPAPGNEPQGQAYESKADILLYGGKPYGGKSDLQLGLARNEHFNSLLLRRTFPELKRGFVPRSIDFYGDRKHFNASENVWRIDGKRIEFGYGQNRDDFLRYKGPNYDLIEIDEASEIARFDDGSTPIDLLLPWNRTTIQKQRVRMVLGTNPGGTGEEWLVEYFGPWLDTEHHNPAEFGELRWFIRNEEGVIVDVEPNTKGSKSRTFIASSWKDNPYAAPEYESNLDILPEPLRSQLKLGLWGVGKDDDRWQVIPSAWVRTAQARWLERDVDHFDSVGVDVAYGGKDKTVFAGKVGSWFAKLKKHEGKTTPDGQSAAGFLKSFIKGNPRVSIDATGYGASCYDFAKEFCNASSFIASTGSKEKDKTGRLGFANLRAEVYWKFREALDPASGEDIALPPDQELLSDLCSARWRLAASAKIQIEPKVDIIKRLGRSPDDADAVVLAWYEAPKAVLGYEEPAYESQAKSSNSVWGR